MDEVCAPAEAKKKKKPMKSWAPANRAKVTLLSFTPMCLGIFKKHEWC